MKKKLQKYFPVMSPEQYSRFENILLGLSARPFSEAEMAELEARLQSKKQADWLLSETAANNNNGISAEKEGHMEKAISFYEKNLQLGYPATHSFDRLMIIYRKQKQFDDELRVLERAETVFKNDESYITKVQKRRQSVLALRNKN